MQISLSSVERGVITNRNIHWAIRSLKEMVREWREPAVTRVARRRDPFKVLISCLLSLRTKDEVTHEAASRLFARADTAQDLLVLSADEIARIIYPVGFYQTKAGYILGICRNLLERYKGQVPREMDELLTLPGVGRKTANLVVTIGHGLPGICVDTHVHRITNRWGYVETRTPHETEFALRERLPGRYWIEFNDLLVTFGQNFCVPISPYCSRCRLGRSCARNGVQRHR
jgi:endonuclease-3